MGYQATPYPKIKKQNVPASFTLIPCLSTFYQTAEIFFSRNPSDFHIPPPSLEPQMLEMVFHTRKYIISRGQSQHIRKEIEMVEEGII